MNSLQRTHRKQSEEVPCSVRAKEEKRTFAPSSAKGQARAVSCLTSQARHASVAPMQAGVTLRTVSPLASDREAFVSTAEKIKNISANREASQRAPGCLSFPEHAPLKACVLEHKLLRDIPYYEEKGLLDPLSEMVAERFSKSCETPKVITTESARITQGFIEGENYFTGSSLPKSNVSKAANIQFGMAAEQVITDCAKAKVSSEDKQTFSERPIKGVCALTFHTQNAISLKPTAPGYSFTPYRPLGKTKISKNDELHEHNTSDFGNLALDIATSVLSDTLPISKKTAALFAYGSAKHEESGIVEAGAGGVAHVAFELGLEHFCETFTEAAIEAGIDSAALRAFIPRHSVIWPVVAAHATRIAADIAVKRLPVEDSHPFDLDGGYSVTDAKIFCGLSSIPGRGLEAIHHALQHAIVAGLHKAGVTDKQIDNVAEATEAACYTLGKAMIELEKCGAIFPL